MVHGTGKFHGKETDFLLEDRVGGRINVISGWQKF